jgi:hypothetical protein
MGTIRFRLLCRGRRFTFLFPRLVVFLLRQNRIPLIEFYGFKYLSIYTRNTPRLAWSNLAPTNCRTHLHTAGQRKSTLGYQGPALQSERSINPSYKLLNMKYQSFLQAVEREVSFRPDLLSESNQGIPIMKVLYSDPTYPKRKILVTNRIYQAHQTISPYLHQTIIPQTSALLAPFTTQFCSSQFSPPS